MKANLRQGIAVVGLALAASVGQASSAISEASLTVLWPKSDKAQAAYQQIKKAGLAESVIEMAHNRMALKEPVTLVLGGGGQPRILVGSQMIVVPYEHLYDIEKDLAASSSDGLASPEVVMDAFLYTLVHQLAHVAIAQQDENGQWLGEDAVADLTMLTLLEHIPQGDRIARNALRLFDKQAIGLVRPRNNYWASHSLNAERYWAGICQLLGSGQAVDEVMPAGEMSNSECSAHYATLKNSWGQMFAQGLDPVVKDAVASR